MQARLVEKVLLLAHNYSCDFRGVIIISIICVVLNACAQNHYQAPVSDMVQPPSRKVSTHLVAPGETLYSIAWRYDLDYSSLARANDIDTDFRIYPGQTLRLDVESRKPWAARQNRTPAVRPPPPSKPLTVPRSKNETTAAKIETKRPVSDKSPTWEWPLRGRVLSGFRAKGGMEKGIDIHGKLGEAVVAASAGEVVYSGDGLRGYGKLLIVKHSDTFLSAYAHNRRLLVEEGETVQAGQKIAEVGSTGTNSVKLYFEIRRDGKPVNPLHYLPKL